MDIADPVGSVVSNLDFEASLKALRAEITDPRAGLFGPGSLAWRLYGDTLVVSLTGSPALLLQSTHPYVAHAIARHSSYRADPAGRLLRTLDALFSWIFGDLEQALRVAREIRGRHDRVVGPLENAVGPYPEGHIYNAADANAMFWVHATLWYVPVQVYERLYGPIEAAEKERYYAQTRRFTKLFGIPDALVPETWEAFCAYFERMAHSDIFTVDRAGSRVPKMMFTAPAPWLKPLAREMEIMTVGFLPEPLRRAHGFRFGPEEQRVFDRTIRWLGRIAPLLPPQVRYFPAYRHAVLRMRPKAPSLPTRLYLRAETELIHQLAWVSSPARRRASRGERPSLQLLGMTVPRPSTLARQATSGFLGAALAQVNALAQPPERARRRAAPDQATAAL